VLGRMRLEPPVRQPSKRAWPVETKQDPVRPQPKFIPETKFEQAVSSDGKLRSGAERMLAALAQWSPEGMSEGQMRAHAGLKKSGTFSAYMSDLRRGSYIEERNGMVF